MEGLGFIKKKHSRLSDTLEKFCSKEIKFIEGGGAMAFSTVDDIDRNTIQNMV